MKTYLLLLLLVYAIMPTAAQTLSMPQNWYEDARLRIQERQASFHKVDKGIYSVVNTQNQLGCIINSKGYQLKNYSQDQANTWEAAFEVLQVNGKPATDASVTHHSARKLVYTAPGYETEYINSNEGLRQNFIIPAPPTAPEDISISIGINSTLIPEVWNNQLSMKDPGGSVRLLYDGLQVWDSRNRPLPATMEWRDNMLHIHVAAAGAAYPVTIDPLNHTPNWTDNGNGLVFPLLNDLSTPILFGFSLSGAGDINNDGYDDVVIGAPTYVDILNISAGTFNVAQVGAAFVYFGSATGLSLNPTEVLQPTSAVGALFGFSVCNTGDINGDGYADVVVGAPGDRITLNVGVIPVATSVAAGKIYVYYGGPAGNFDGNANTEPSISVSVSLQQSDFGALLAVPVNPLYGFSVTNAGDVNGNGFDDVLVGAPAYNRLLPIPLRSGRVDVYYGSGTGISAGSRQTITGGILNALFGYSVSFAGNVNGDLNAGRSIDDIIVGAPGDLTFLGAGQAYVFHGAAGGISATTTAGANRTLNSGGLLTTLFGLSVAGLGDVNGDGYGDVAIGEPAALENILTQLVSVGQVHIFYGSATGVSLTGSTKLSSPRRPSILGLIEGNLLYGFNVSGPGDVSGDGIADLIVGEPGGTALSLGSGLLGLVSTNQLSGRAYVYFGVNVTGPNNQPSFTVQQTGAITVANLIGYSTAGAGDVNGDGRRDIIIGAPNGTIDLSGGIIPLVGNVLGIVMANSVGSAYIFDGYIQADLVLPLSVSFTAARNDASAVLEWKTGDETGLDYFILEHSVNGRDFTSLAVVFPQGRVQGAAYNYTHAQPAPRNFYRLKIYKRDGSYSYSAILPVHFDKDIQAIVTTWPNPTSGSFQFRLQQVANGYYNIRLFSNTGILQYEKRVKVEAGNYTGTADIRSLPPGNYFLGVYATDGTRAGSASLIIQ